MLVHFSKCFILWSTLISVTQGVWKNFLRNQNSSDFRRELLNTNVFDRVEEVPPPSQSHIIGGSLAQPGAYPFYVHSTGFDVCGGTLIWPDMILTGPDCSMPLSGTAFVGSTKLDGGDGERVWLGQTIVHPEYNQLTGENGIVIVTLHGTSSARRVTLNRNKTLPLEGQRVKVIGFGYTGEVVDDEELPSPDLLEANITVLNIDRCTTGFPSNIGKVSPETHICTGTTEGFPKGPCWGDTGGPLLDVDSNVQYGIFSFGYECFDDNFPFLFTDVSVHIDYIERVICDYSNYPPASCPEDEYHHFSPSPTIKVSATPSTGEPSSQQSPPPTTLEAIEQPEPTKSPSLPPVTRIPTISPSSTRPTTPFPSTAPVTAVKPTPMPGFVPTLPPRTSSPTVSRTPAPTNREATPTEPGSERPRPASPPPAVNPIRTLAPTPVARPIMPMGMVMMKTTAVGMKVVAKGMMAMPQAMAMPKTRPQEGMVMTMTAPAKGTALKVAMQGMAAKAPKGIGMVTIRVRPM